MDLLLVRASVILVGLLLYTEAASGPFILSRSTNYTAELGSDAVKLKCVLSPQWVKKAPLTTNTWTKNGKLMVLTAKEKYRFKKFKFLRILSLNLDDTGEYGCQMSNSFGTENITIFVTVKVSNLTHAINNSYGLPPRLTSSPTDLVAELVGNEVALDCRAVGEKPMKTLWFKGVTPLQETGMTDISYRDNNQIVTLKNLIPDHKGHYTCLVTNRHGMANYTFTLDVLERARAKPILLEAKTNYTVAIGNNISVSCIALSDSSMHFQLLRFVVNVTEHTTSRDIQKIDMPTNYDHSQISGALDRYEATYHFVNVSDDDYGEYTCMAGNNIGHSVRMFRLQLLVPAVSTVAPNKRAAAKNDDALVVSLLVLFGVFILVVCCLVSAVAYLQWQKKRTAKFNAEKMYYSRADGNDTLVYGDGKSPQNWTTGIDPTTGLLTRQRSRKASSRSRISSNVTEYTTLDIPYDPEWEVDVGTLDFHHLLGEGAFGRVLKATAYQLPGGNDAPKTVAVKVLKNSPTDQQLSDLISEMEVMKMIGRHNNIINLLGVSTQQNELCVIVEYCHYGNLRDYLRSRRPVNTPLRQPDDKLSLFDLTSYALQVAKGMDYLASKKCIHRDLAARNVLVGDTKVMKIADFGLARDIHASEYYKKTTGGQLPVKWMALEALFDRVYTTQSDVWAFGVLVWEIITFGGTPYPGVPLQRMYDLLKDGYRMERPINCTDDMYNVMVSCWQACPTNRPTFSVLIVQLQQMLSDIGEKEYLELQPPIVGAYSLAEGESDVDPTSTPRDSLSSSVFDKTSDAFPQLSPAPKDADDEPFAFDDTLLTSCIKSDAHDTKRLLDNNNGDDGFQGNVRDVDDDEQSVFSSSNEDDDQEQMLQPPPYRDERKVSFQEPLTR